MTGSCPRYLAASGAEAHADRFCEGCMPHFLLDVREACRTFGKSTMGVACNDAADMKRCCLSKAMLQRLAACMFDIAGGDCRPNEFSPQSTKGLLPNNMAITRGSLHRDEEAESDSSSAPLSPPSLEPRLSAIHRHASRSLSRNHLRQRGGHDRTPASHVSCSAHCWIPCGL